MHLVTRPLARILACLVTLLSVLVLPAHAGVKFGQDVPGLPEVPVAPGPRATPAIAEVLIDFDDVAAPCLFMETVPLRTAYLPLGVSFTGVGIYDGGAILNACSNFSVSGFSGSNFLAFNNTAGYPTGGIPQTPETITFTSPVAAVSLLVGSGLNGSVVSLDAYDAANVLVASNSRSLVSGLAPLGVTAPSISRVVLSGGGIFVADNLRFTPGGIVPARAHSWGQLKAFYR